MQLVINEDQALLAETAKEFVSEKLPVSRVRKLREDPLGFDPKAWKQIADLGWTSLPFSEDDGGLGLGNADVAIVTEALGRGLATEPYVSTVMLAGKLLAKAGTADQKSAHLAPLIAGTAHVALAHGERHSRFDPFRVATRAEKAGDGFVLSGEKHQVLGGPSADTFIVVARTSGSEKDEQGLSLFLVPKAASGLRIERQYRVDAAPTSLVSLQGVKVTRAALLGPEGGAGPLLTEVIDGATVALTAEMLGGMTEALERTLRYLKERTQFGVAIGTFQALKHRAARLFIEVELTRSAVMAAARALDEAAHSPGGYAGAKNARALVSVAKARASDAYLLVANEAVQMHGGIGMTDEHDIGFFLKRARAAEMTFGDAAFHRDRFATAHGF
jgi:alkylation response protein AidB-like acyl-CoA dehydrogenase